MDPKIRPRFVPRRLFSVGNRNACTTRPDKQLTRGAVLGLAEADGGVERVVGGYGEVLAHACGAVRPEELHGKGGKSGKQRLLHGDKNLAGAVPPVRTEGDAPRPVSWRSSAPL